jgi:uncharacterized cupredoxin-like copper-binding protein
MNLFEHIFREFANRGIDPFGYGQDNGEPEDDWLDDDTDYGRSSDEPMEAEIRMTPEGTFEPDQLEAEAGRPLRLFVDNADTTPHDFTIDRVFVEVTACETSVLEPAEHEAPLGLHMCVDSLACGTLEFTPRDGGVYEFRCTGEDHADTPMTGLLIVS